MLRPIWALFVGSVALVGYLIPKNRNLWVFGNFKGFADSSRYLLEYVAREHREIRVVWLARTLHHRDEARRAGHEAEMIGSIRGVALAFRAKVGVILNGSRDLNRAALASQFVVNLWHGTPFKRVLLDSRVESVNIPLVGGLLTRLGRYVLRMSFRTFDIIVAPSDYVAERLTSAFRTTPERVVITGTPRADVILENSETTPPRPPRILLAPTWRASGAPVELFPGLNGAAWNPILRSSGAILCFKLHPLMTQALDLDLAALDPAHVEHLDSDLDLNPVMADFSMLITDYSAIAFDFALLGRPIFFVCPDQDEYDRRWGLYERMDSLVGPVLHQDFTSLAPVVRDVLANPDDYPGEVLQRLTNKRFLRYGDSGSRGRIMREIFTRIEPSVSNVPPRLSGLRGSRIR